MKKTVAAFLVLVSILSACSTALTDTGVDEATARSFDKFNLVYMAETKEALYFINDAVVNASSCLIYYFDKSSGTIGPLCGKPECGHDNADCNAFTRTYTGEGGKPTFPGGNGARGLSIQNGRLYWALFSGADGLIVFSSALDGTDHRQEGVSGRELIPSTRNNYSMAWSDKYAFFSCEAKGVTDAVATERNYICAIPLNSKEETIVILDEETAYNYLTAMQVYDGYLYFITSDRNPPLDETKWGSSTFKIRRWNLETHETETVFEDPDSGIDSPYALWVTDDQILFNEYSSEKRGRCVDRYDFETGECGRLYDLGVSTTEGTLEKTFAYLEFADNISVGYELLKDKANTFRVAIKDFDGKMLVNDTYKVEPMDGTQVNDIFMNGVDDEYVYFTFTSRREKYTSGLTPVAVPLDGGEARTLGTVELPGHGSSSSED